MGKAHDDNPAAIDGLGKTIPPPSRFVQIYFEQKGRSISEAITFLKSCQNNKWTTYTGKKIKNWKVEANNWIWELLQEERFGKPSAYKI